MKTLIWTAALLATCGTARADILMHARVEAFDTLGNPIDEIAVGSDFELRAFVDDVRTTSENPGVFGVFSAFMNVTFDAGKVAIAGPVVNASEFSLLPLGSTSPGFVQAGGAYELLLPDPPGSDEQLLFTVPLHAAHLGVVTFSPSFAQDDEFEWALFGRDDLLFPDEVLFFADALTIVVPEPASVVLLAMAVVPLAVLAWRRRLRRG